MKSARQVRINRIIEEHGSATVHELGQQLNVSETTIRRDLDDLASEGRVKRAHGGAITTNLIGKEAPLLERHQEMADAKAAIAKRAARFVSEGDTVFLSPGSTVARVAEHIAHLQRLTVITNSLAVVNSLDAAAGVDVILIGGPYQKAGRAFLGIKAVEAIDSYRADIAFIGVRAIDLDQGLTGDSIDDSSTDRAILRISSTSIVLADHTKFGGVAAVSIAPVPAIDTIITDTNLDPATRERLSHADVRTIYVEEGS